MSNKYSRHQSIINREADAHIDEDHWLKQFEKNLQKSAVQSRRVDDSLFNQINSIMNNKSKYTSVSSAVEDMMQRSGLTDHLKNINKVSQEEAKTITASDPTFEEAELEVMKYAKKVEKAKKLHKSVEKVKDLPLPKVIKEVPSILKTLENYIESTKGNLDIVAILEKVKDIHKSDVSNANDWDDENLLRLISDKKLKEQINKVDDREHHNLGRPDTSIDNFNDSNTDAFSALMPAKI